MNHVRPLDQNLWVIERPHRMAGMQLGTRSTLIRHANQDLTLISPGAFNDAVWAEIDALGVLTTLIAPNIYHHLFLNNAAERYPEAHVFLTEGLPQKVRALPHGTIIDPGTFAFLAPELLVTTLQGSTTNESVFFHPSTRTLIVTDLVFNIQQGGLWTRWMMKLNGGFGRLGPTKMLRASIQDDDAFRRSLEHLLAWDTERIIMAHGELVQRDGQKKLHDAFADYL